MAKFAFIIACCLLVLLNVCVARPDKDAIKEKVMGYLKECQTEVGATDSEVQNVMQKKPAASMEGKCLRACGMKKMGLMDENGKYVKATALEFAKKCSDGDAEKLAKVTTIIDACSADLPSNECEAAEQYKSCFWDKTKAMNMEW